MSLIARKSGSEGGRKWEANLDSLFNWSCLWGEKVYIYQQEEEEKEEFNDLVEEEERAWLCRQGGRVAGVIAFVIILGFLWLIISYIP